MDPILFLKGLLVGFAMAVPIGPVGIMCIRKTLMERHSRGLMTGLGAATADSLYGGIAAFGLTFITDIIAGQQLWLHLGGGILLLVLGIKTFRVTRERPSHPFDNRGVVGSYLAAFLLAVSNPVTIFAFIAVFAAFGLGNRGAFITRGMLVAGVFTGSFLWFVTLGHVATVFRHKLDSGGLIWVNRVSGVLIMLSGIVAFVSMI
jgi:threonine/homoserine/homoserine lactone efflux protein